MNVPVCQVMAGNGFTIEHMPDFLEHEEIDNSSPHVHSFYEILWFQQGAGMHTVDFLDYEIRPNTLFFLSPGQIHHFDHNHNYQGVSLKLCADFLKNEAEPNCLLLKYNVFHNYDAPPCYHIDHATGEELSRLVNEMEVEAPRVDAFGNLVILQSQLRIFLVKILRHGERDGELRLDMLRPQHRLFINFRSLVEKEFMNLHTVQQYADRLHVAVRTLNKCVNECSQTSPLTFINNRIILEAKRQVRYSNLMVKEIAYNLGFEDPSYFVKLFKRHTGVMPSEFKGSSKHE